MSEDRAKANATPLLPELPRDMPMPLYRYQREERSGAAGASAPEDLRQKAANLLTGLHMMGCAAAGAN